MSLKVEPALVEVKIIPPGFSNTGMSAVNITCGLKGMKMN